MPINSPAATVLEANEYLSLLGGLSDCYDRAGSPSDGELYELRTWFAHVGFRNNGLDLHVEGHSIRFESIPGFNWKVWFLPGEETQLSRVRQLLAQDAESLEGRADD